MRPSSGNFSSTAKNYQTYKIILPDGTVSTNRSFKGYGAAAEAGCYLHDGKWFVAAIWGAGECPAGQTSCPASLL